MHDQELSRYRSLDELINDIRGLGDESDGALRALLNVAPFDESAVAAVIVALLPLALSRCTGSRDRVDDLISELAIVIGEVAADRASGVEPPRGERPP